MLASGVGDLFNGFSLSIGVGEGVLNVSANSSSAGVSQVSGFSVAERIGWVV